MEEKLTDENFLRFCLKHYQNPYCVTLEDFEKDIKIIRYIKRQFSKYRRYKKIDAQQCRLTLNHIITFYNIFERSAATKILFYRIDSSYYSYLKPYLLYISVLPEIVNGIETVNMDMDKKIIKTLREL